MTASSHRVRQTQHNIQCLYNLDCRVHAVQAYPVLSPQGASIVLYGHENGVTILWRGGRRLKEAAARAKKDEPKPASNSNKNAAAAAADAVMVLDSDSDEATTAAAAPFVDKPVFDEDGPAQATMEGGFLDVVQTLDLAFGTAVTSIAVLPHAPCAAADAEPRLLQEQMVFAVACATADLYVVALPLTPPSPESKARPQLRAAGLLAAQAGRGAFGERLLPLGGAAKSADGLAMALAKHKETTTTTATAASPLRVVVAAHAREAAGTLRLWAVTVPSAAAAAAASTDDRPAVPFQTAFLPCPLAGLAFNPTHPTQLLVVDPRHAVRVYDYTVPALPAAADDDDDLAAAGKYPPQGAWLLSLYPPFVRGSGGGGSAVTAPRKPVVAAAWVAHGHAILALLADGQWGVWDIDRASTTASSSSSGGGLFAGRQWAAAGGAATGGVRGAALTAFAVSGQIEGTTPLRNPVAGARKSADGDFVPMTPHTRRDVLGGGVGGSGGGGGGGAGFFGGTAERLAGVRGGVAVVQQRAGRGSAAGPESAVLWLGGADYTVAVIPDVARFWDAQLRRDGRGSGGGGGGGLFQGARPTRMTRLADLHASLLGERCCGVSVVARPAAAAGTGDDEDEDDSDPSSASSSSSSVIEVVVQGESRLVVVRETGADAFSGALASRLQAAAPSLRKRTGRAAGGGGVDDGSTRAIVVEPSQQTATMRKPGTVSFDLLGTGGSLWATAEAGAAAAASAASAPLLPTTPRHRRPPLTKTLFDTPGGGGGGGASRGAGPAPGIAAMTPRQAGGGGGGRPLFDENEVTLTMSMRKPPAQWRQRQQQANRSQTLEEEDDEPLPAKTGLTFAGDLEEAANAADDEEAADERNIEEEMLDIMEIDRALEALEEQRDGGAKNVFFEGV